jgi:hypothetical protein
LLVSRRANTLAPALIPRCSQNPVDNLLIKTMLAGRNGRESRLGAVSSGGLFATMEAQQAVAISFVGRRVTTLDVPFF